MSDYTTILFARPSFLEGVARLLDFGNTLQAYNTSPDEWEADAWALAADWQAIGEDMKLAMQEIAHEQTQPQQTAR